MKAHHTHKEPSGPIRKKNFFSRESNSLFARDYHFFTQKSNQTPALQPKLASSQPIAGKHILAHELTHTVQQKETAPGLQQSPQPNQKVEDCLTQKNGALLPGKVGVVEQINRDVGLEEILGKDRAALEAEIRQNKDARRFVCEAGISAMLALYYNRDYKKRIFVEKARKSLSIHPEYYSFTGSDKTKQTKEMLEKKYGIFIESGNKPWSPRDTVLLAEALGKLTEKEIPLISNYHFIRWTNRCHQLMKINPDYTCDLEDYGVCGLHEPEIVDRKYTITMYDCMGGDPDDEAEPGYQVRPGAETIVHEIGHAMEFGKKRLAIEKAFDAKKEYERIKKQSAAATTAAGKAAIAEKLIAAKKAKDEVEKAMDATLAGAPIEKFKKLIKRKKPLTPYSGKNDAEAFAEAYMLFKVAPEKLKKANKPLFNWFNQGGYL